MLNITLICTGKLKEKYYIDAYREYLKRLSAYAKVDIIEISEARLPSAPSKSQINAALDEEGSAISAKIPKNSYIIAMCIGGEQISSEELADFISRNSVSGMSRLCIIIGGSNGMSESIKSSANLKLSMSKMTFPHHLARIMVLEQIYRAFKIIEGGSYHK